MSISRKNYCNEQRENKNSMESHDKGSPAWLEEIFKKYENMEDNKNEKDEGRESVCFNKVT